jgi:quinol monooxygenase YgiN
LAERPSFILQQDLANMHLDPTYWSRSLPLVAVLLLKVGITPGAEVNAGQMQALTYIEVRAEARGYAAGVLRQQANASGEHRASPAQIIPMQEISRPERFAVLEREAPAALTAGGRKAHVVTEGLADDLTAPPDQRLNRELDDDATVTSQTVDARANFYVVTHVDIATPDRRLVETALYKLGAAARHTAGNLGFEILQQIDRPNHFNLISAWIGESPFRAFAASATAREFRQTLAPLLGSPYDERLFRRVD